MTEFYRSPTRERIVTKPTVELRSCRKMGSFALTEMNDYGAEEEPSASPSPQRMRKAVLRQKSSESAHIQFEGLANTQFDLAPVPEENPTA